MNRVIAVDFDGTLAEYNGWQGPAHVGAPIQKMVDRVVRWLQDGDEVVIFTARLGHGGQDAMKSKKAIEKFCVENFGMKLSVTNEKTMDMGEFWDDKAIRVETNTGEIVKGEEP